jgi:hypothetical protein
MQRAHWLRFGYALDALKLDGVTTTTSLNNVYLGEPQFDPWLEELNRRSATLFVHPTITRAGETLLNGLNASVIEFTFDTTRMITNMVATGAKKRFSQIKIISTHGGGYERRSKNKPQNAVGAALCGGVKVVHRGILVS